MELATNYMGLPLRNPLVASASPLSQTVEGVCRLADAGIGAVVLYSLFEERPDSTSQNAPVSLPYLRLLERAAGAVDIPVIASFNGGTAGGWAEHAEAMEGAGAAAVELNIYYIPGDRRVSGPNVEVRHVDVLERVKAVVDVPVAMKLSPFFSSTGHMAVQLDKAGADALVLFNRFLQPDIDCETLAAVPEISLSTPAEARLPRTWIALLYGRVRASLAATTGVEDPSDVAKYLLAGADVVMTASALLRHGPEYASVLLDGLSEWMKRQGFASVEDLRGLLSVPSGTDEVAHEREGYVATMRAANSTVYSPW